MDIHQLPILIYSWDIESTMRGGGGGIDSVQAGTNIIIDNSDPSNPIINATFSQEESI